MTEKKIVLVRHGQTAWSLAGKHTGLTDIPLTDEGKKQAELLQKRLQGMEFATVLTSPLQRAKETCRLAGREAVVEPDLVEWDYGAFEGLTSKEIQKTHPGWGIFSHGAPGGESLQDVEERVARVLAKCERISGDVLLFSSAHILRALAVRWLGFPLIEGQRLFLSPASISILSFEHQRRAIFLWNATS